MNLTPHDGQIQAWEKAKEVLILRYQKLQDQVDSLNGVIFELCTQIEVLNLKLATAREGSLPESPPPRHTAGEEE